MRKAFVLLMVSVLALSVVQPALAKDYDLLIHNNTEANVKITLEGPEDYSFTVEPGKTFKTVEEGTYDYKYDSCGVQHTGSISVTQEGVWLIVENCPPEQVKAKFVVNSHFGETIVLSMSGPEEYELTVSLGSNRFLDIVAGNYTYSYEACDGIQGGEIRVTKNGKARLTLRSCERQALLDFGLPNPSNLRIGSHYSFPLNMTLIGPQQYFFELQPGYNRLDVIRGTYTYLYTAYGQSYSGQFDVTGGGAWVIFSPTPLKP